MPGRFGVPAAVVEEREPLVPFLWGVEAKRPLPTVVVVGFQDDPIRFFELAFPRAVACAVNSPFLGLLGLLSPLVPNLQGVISNSAPLRS